ncbi:oxidoreductase [Halorubrum sp. SY-15]|uniref:oxidoreductase n=1 Tax=Halorubrum sp. SY-15 TaxID=3402277 RepID=UPI003EBE1A6C
MSDLFDLSDEVAVVTGGAGLIGSALCEGLAEHGATVVLVDADEDAAAETANSIGGHVVTQAADVTSAPEMGAVFEYAVDAFGSVDTVVNSAYPRNERYGTEFQDVSLSDWEENIALNLNSYYISCKKSFEIMRRQETGGSIVNLGSIYGVQAPDFDVYTGTDMTGPVEYSAIKGAVINFTRYLASYAGKYGVRANVLSPGGVFDEQAEQFVTQYESKVPLSRMARPEDLKGPVVYLSSDSSKYMTGQNLIVDGGWTIK